MNKDSSNLKGYILISEKWIKDRIKLLKKEEKTSERLGDDIRAGIEYWCGEELKGIIKQNNIDMKDNINPDHYKNTSGIECIHAIEAALSREEFRGYLRGNILKYNWRCMNKNGPEDINKGIWYATLLAKKLEALKTNQ